MSEETTIPVESQDGVTLGLQDIANAVKVIDVCVSRGAVQGDELSSVGRVRDRLVAFVNSQQPPQETPTPPEEGETEDSAETIEVDVTEEG